MSLVKINKQITTTTKKNTEATPFMWNQPGKFYGMGICKNSV